MPDESAHIAAYAGHLRSYRDTVANHPDWGAVMLFYCAVHLVEQMLAREGKHSCEHSDRDFELKSRYQSIWNGGYRVLKAESMKARYLANGAFTMPAAKVESKLVPLLEQVQADIESRLKARRIPGL